MPHRVAFLGFTESERHALSAYFRLAHNRTPSYEHVATLTDADFLVADADHAPSVQLVVITERLGETVFIGAHPPEGSVARLKRPIDALHVMRELDAIVARHAPVSPVRDDRAQHTTIIQAMRRQRDTAAAGEPARETSGVLLGDLPFSAPDPAGPAVAAPPAAAAWPPEAPAQPGSGPYGVPPEALAEDAMPSSPAPLTLRDPPTPAPGDATSAAGHELFPGTDGLVGHEPPLPRQPGGWTEDLTALQAAPLPVLSPAAGAGPAEPALPTLPAPRPAPPVLRELAASPEALPAAESPPRRPRLLGQRPPSPAPASPSAPAAASAGTAPLPIKPPKPPKVPKATLLPSAPRALLVDDSAIALLFLEKRLETWHVHTDQASNSQAALALLAQQSYDLVFLDVELGTDSELDGLALCRQIKQTPSSMNALVVMVSAHHTELDRVRGSLAGCDAYLAKPLDGTELQRLLQRQGLNPRAEAGTVPS